MTTLFKTGILYVTTPECYDRYFVDFDFLHGACMKATLSKIIGLVIVLGALTVKVPQILKIIQNKSGEGISLTGSILELLACTSFFAYSYQKQFPFSAWGDGLFMAIQTVCVIGLILHYKNQPTQSILFILSSVVVMFLIVTGILPLPFLWIMQILNLPLVILGKGAQIMTNYKIQSTGQLSAITCWMQFGGCLARVFTSIQETGDAAIILTFIIASTLNGTIVFQILYYGSASGKKTKGEGKGKSKGQKFN